MGQLQYWRSDRGGRGPVLVPEHRDGRTWLYSYRDVVAIRTVVYLREDKSLQKIRRALETLDDVGERAPLSEFRDKDGGLVRPLHEPFPHIRVSPDVRGGYPVIKDTRVPYDNVATIVRDGVAPRSIRGIYPAVTAAAARDAAAFADYVDERTQPRRAA
jgi:uncharacterized protein (DUF433 family)